MALSYLALSLAYSLSQLNPSFFRKYDHGHTALLTRTGEGFWFCWENIIFDGSGGGGGEAPHAEGYYKPHKAGQFSGHYKSFSGSFSVLERQRTIPAQDAKNTEEATM